MADIKPKSKSKKTVEEPKVVAASDPNEIQVHFGNYKKIEIALLNNINATLVKLLKIVEKADKE